MGLAPRGLRSFVPLLGLCVGLAATTQLVMELWGVCGDELPAAAACPRHLVLGGVALAAFGAMVLSVLAEIRASSSALDAKRRLRLSFAALPFSSNRAAFIGVVGVLQFGLAAAAHTGEGPVWTQDALGWAVGAMLSSLLATALAWLALRHLPGFVVALLAEFIGDGLSAIRQPSKEPPRATRREHWPSQLFNRPPPLSQPA